MAQCMYYLSTLGPNEGIIYRRGALWTYHVIVLVVVEFRVRGLRFRVSADEEALGDLRVIQRLLKGIGGNLCPFF